MRWTVTKAETKEIRRLTRRRVRQSEIARRLGIAAPAVSKAQREMGLPTTLPWPDAKILAALKEGKGLYTIARQLRVPVGQITRVRRENNVRRAYNSGIAFESCDIDGFAEAIKNREGYIRDLARKFRVGQVKANRLAHKILQTIRFRPGATNPPLSSNFPQRHFGPRVRK